MDIFAELEKFIRENPDAAAIYVSQLESQGLLPPRQETASDTKR